MPYEDSDRLTKFYSQAFGWQMNKFGPEMGDYVTAGTTDGNVTAVDGIKAGDVIAVDGFDKLQNGVKVTVRGSSEGRRNRS